MSSVFIYCIYWWISFFLENSLTRNSFFKFFNVYFWERAHAHLHVQGTGRDRGRQRIQSRLCADSRKPNAELEPTNCEVITWAKVRCLTYWATQVHLEALFECPTGTHSKCPQTIFFLIPLSWKTSSIPYLGECHCCCNVSPIIHIRNLSIYSNNSFPHSPWTF